MLCQSFYLLFQKQYKLRSYTLYIFCNISSSILNQEILKSHSNKQANDKNSNQYLKHRSRCSPASIYTHTGVAVHLLLHAYREVDVQLLLYTHTEVVVHLLLYIRTQE